MVGYNTALADNPRLTARLWTGKQPLRVVLDRKLQLPAQHHLLNGSAESWIVNEHQESAAGLISHIQIPFDEQLLPAILNRLIAAHKTSLFVEGGVRLLQHFIAANLWDEARVFTASKVLGGGIASPLLHASDLAFEMTAGDDALHLYQPVNTQYPYPAGALFQAAL
jgi:diaminohydroxyphosphoribosylaminopyrimidine deaminase/5-amino-6-(5-phosphoribosylamino)uracil reductase